MGHSGDRILSSHITNGGILKPSKVSETDEVCMQQLPKPRTGSQSACAMTVNSWEKEREDGEQLVLTFCLKTAGSRRGWCSKLQGNVMCGKPCQPEDVNSSWRLDGNECLIFLSGLTVHSDPLPTYQGAAGS